MYDAGSAEDTDYTYNTTSGQLTQRNNPVVSSANVRTTYAYDAAGRLSGETVTREAGGTTNLYRTAYAYSWLTYGKQVIRTEQTFSLAWVNDNRLTYEWDSLSRQEFEQRDDWDSGAFPPAWATRYDVTQEYDKNGNRTRLHRNTVGGYESDYGNSEDLSYTYNVVNQLTAISDADDGNFSCTVTCDNNNNITQIEEVQTSGQNTATLTTDFTYDWGNRLTQHKTLQYNNAQEDSWITKRGHTIDAIGRTAKSSYLTYWNMELPGSPDTLEHTYDRSRHIQNYDGSSYGEVWHWAGAANQHSAPLKSPNADTASQKGYNIANDKTPQRRTFTNPTSEGDQRHLYGQGKPQAKNSSGSGSNWYLGTASEGLAAVTVNSRTMFEGTVTATDMDRATDAREKGRIGIFGIGNAYAGSYGRVTSERIGRDLNPLGRGSGYALVGGQMNYGRLAPRLPLSKAKAGSGSSVNNSGQCGISGGCGGSSPPGFSTAGLGGSTGLTTQGLNCDWCCETFYDRNGRWEGDVPLDCYTCDCETRGGRTGPGTGGGGNGGWGPATSNMDYAGECGENSRCGRKCWSFKGKTYRPGGRLNEARCSHVGTETCTPMYPYPGCSFCWPNARQFCYACDVFTNYDPCYCALHDCVIDCIMDKSGAQDLIDMFELSAECAELLEDYFSGGSGGGLPCPQLESGDPGEGGSGYLGLGADEQDIIDCLDELYRKTKEILDRIKNHANNPDAMAELASKFLKCTMCCVSNYALCLAIAFSGFCDPTDALHGGPVDNHWRRRCIIGWL